MPSLVLTAPRRYEVGTKRLVAQRMGEVYARTMGADPGIVTVAVHDLGEGGVWRCTEGQPVQAALLMCDMRAGRPVGTRAKLAEALIAVCADAGGLDPLTVKVEFTQHTGDEMYHPHLHGFNDDWHPDDATAPPS